MTPVAAVSPPAAVLVQQSQLLPSQMRGGMQMRASHTCSALKLACKSHKCKHSPRYKAKSVCWCHQKLLLCFISQVAHKLLCLLNFAGTSCCFTPLLYCPCTLHRRGLLFASCFHT